MRALVAGATGLVGQSLVEELLGDPAFTEIYLLVRRPTSIIQNPRIIEITVDFNHDLLPLVPEQVDVCYCCLGTTMKQAGSKEAFVLVDYEYVVRLAEACKKKGVNHFGVISAMGANAKSSIFYNRTKGEMENALIRLNFPRLSVFRPSLLIGNRAENRLGERVGIVFNNALNFLIPEKYKGIHVEDVAKAMHRVALEQENGYRVYENDLLSEIAKK